jgi:hypothetical protein
MQRLTNHTTRAQGIAPLVQNSIRVENSLTQKIERTRAEVRRALGDVQAVEGRFLDYATAEAIQRALVAAARNLQELTLQVAVLERKR